MAKPYQIILAENDTIVREGIKAILAGQPDLEVVSEAADGLEAVRCAMKTQADLILMDLSMPRMNGMQAIDEIKSSCPEIAVLVLTVQKAEQFVYETLRSGADGYMLKDDSCEELLLGIRKVLSGHRYLSPQISQKVIDGYLEGKEKSSPDSLLEDLTQREREVLKLVAEGYRNREIAEYLFISEKTVEKHRRNLMRKLDVRSVQDLMVYLIEKGVIAR